MGILVLEEAEQTQGGLVPPNPPRRLAVATDDPEKPRCKHCNHTSREHIEGQTCQGKAAFNQPCVCTKYEPKDS